MNAKIYEYESMIYNAEQKGGAYVIFPYDIREELVRGALRCMLPLMGNHMTAVLSIWALKMRMAVFATLSVCGKISVYG